MSNETKDVVMVGTESFSLAEIPSAKSSLVTAACADVMDNLKLDKLISDLELCKQLIYLAANGVRGAGTAESVAIVPMLTELHERFISVCGQADIQLNAIADGSVEVQNQLVLVFELLFMGEVETALDLLNGFSAIAEGLSNSSSKLAGQFDELEKLASKILGDTQLALGAGEQAHAKLQAQIKELKIQTDKANRLVKQVQEAQKKLEEDYQEAKEKAEDAETKSFALSIVGAIFKPLAAGLGAGLAIYSGGGAAGALKNKVADALPEDATKAAAENTAKEKEKEHAEAKDIADKADKESEDAEKDVVAVEKTVEKVKADVEAETSRLNALTDKIMDDKDEKIKAQKAKLATVKADLAAAEKKASDASATLAEKKLASKDARAKLELKSKALKEAVDAAGVAADKFTKMGENYAEVASSYRKEVSELRKLIIEQVKQEHDALSNIQEYAARMKNAGPDLKGIELACDSLFQAVGALKQIVMILQEASYFWLKMAAACKRLQDSSVVKRVGAFVKVPEKTRVVLLAKPEFKENVIRYYAGWKALEVIAKQFAAKATAVRAAAAHDFIEHPTQEQARSEARRLGEKLLKSVSAGLVQNEATLQALASLEAPAATTPKKEPVPA